jgi:CDGSH-type Zn-finger protein
MPEQPAMRILVTENGPYIVMGSVPVTERYPAMSTAGEPLAWDPVGARDTPSEVSDDYALCRCGGSSTKPYCDGTHETNNFDGTLTADPGPSAARRRSFHGHGVTMTDEPGLCVHAGFCGTRFANVWQMMRQTGDPEVRARLEQMVMNCPSGRLEVTLEGESAPIEPEFAPSIAPIPDGPLWVRSGKITLEGPDGTRYEVRNRMTLCRCGQSKNKPFCDGTHVEAGFQAPLRKKIKADQQDQ